MIFDRRILISYIQPTAGSIIDGFSMVLDYVVRVPVRMSSVLDGETLLSAEAMNGTGTYR
jgi:hypothetical protein